MLADIASSKACTMIRGQFRPLRARERPGVATGVLWIRECEITNTGTHVTFHLVGGGWQWAKQTKSKAGGEFAIEQYVPFTVDTKITGTLDIGYDREAHVVSLWFSPDSLAKVGFEPVGDIDVDREGVWSSIVGGLSSVFSDSPEEIADGEAKKQGKHDFQTQLADGLAVTINLCTGLSRFNLGREPKGKMQPADVGETKRVAVELQPGGLAIFGPQLAPDGMTIHVETDGAARMTMVCADYAENVATGFIGGNVKAGVPAGVPVLGAVDVHGKGKLKIPAAKCPVMVIAAPLDNAPATVRWLRLGSEIARSTGGPIVECAKSARASR